MQLSWQTLLQKAQAHARSGRFPEMLAACQQILTLHGDQVAALLDVGALLLNSGFLARAHECFERARTLAPGDLRPLVNLANLARDAGDHAESQRLYAMLRKRLPDHPVIGRNSLVSLEYAPAVADSERLAQARAWGEWAMAQAGGMRVRPPLRPLAGRPLRIGYVSADLCQHTVGLFIKDVLKAHDPERVTAFAYNAGTVSDWATRAIRACTRFRDIARLDDTAVAQRIRQDDIDVLVDLSGHTAGSRLIVFAHRSAPVQVSWLGYFATTGLPTLDAVLLDDWHAPRGTETAFVEPIIRLPMGRFCYTPVPWMPAVSPVPSSERDRITFGCFNNTAKLNSGVLDLWARILAAVPASRLILKWRTFNDDALRQSVRDAFTGRGITPARIELRGPSFHAAQCARE